MNIIDKIKQLPELKLFLTTLIAVLSYYLLKSLFINTEIFQNIELYYAKIQVSVLNIILDGYTVDFTKRAIIFNERATFFSHALVIKYFLLSALILFLFPRNLKKTIWIYLLTSVLFFCLTTIRLLVFNIFSMNIMAFLTKPLVQMFITASDEEMERQLELRKEANIRTLLQSLKPNSL